ncbi:MAG: KAP family NTPase [Muribaculaceae bacterium]|nr:KAP family NTPase [Muribaculaceae bacterium]
MLKENKTSLSDVPFIPSNENHYDFGTERYVNGLIKFIKNSSTPITIALQGEWGSGKTSLMTRLQRVLCYAENAPFIGVNINTWEYSMMSSPEITVYKILAKLVREMTGENSETKKKVSKILRVLYRGGREALKMIPGVNVAVEMANIPSDLNMDGNDDGNDISLSELRDELQKAVLSRLAEKEQRGVIIFVDDLDRLNPSVAVEILELLKNVFSLENCIFVLAIDYDVVVKGLEPKFGKLTEKNEREFRSFFDKIIQVPFSLPVSSYRPMDFVLKSLVEIEYLKEIDASDPNVRTRFALVVEASVGKNPRSIKRLINTLSLLDCIDQCASSYGENKSRSLDDKLLNFIVVAIQICYPRIYRLLVHNPNFIEWNREFARKVGISIYSDKTDTPSWEDILEAACESDKYLTQHVHDIMHLFSMIIELLESDGGDDSENIGMRLKCILDKSSVTGLNADLKADDFDRKDFISKLHRNVIDRMKILRPEISTKPKYNTGNGGVYITLDKKTKLNITFRPVIKDNGCISLRISPDFKLSRPERMMGLAFDEIIMDPHLYSGLSALDSVISPLLTSVWYFKGRTHEGHPDSFKSYLDDLRYCHVKGWLSEDITDNPEYSIDLRKASLFEDEKVVDTIANLLIANYDFRKSMKDWS